MPEGFSPYQLDAFTFENLIKIFVTFALFIIIYVFCFAGRNKVSALKIVNLASTILGPIFVFVVSIALRNPSHLESARAVTQLLIPSIISHASNLTFFGITCIVLVLLSGVFTGDLIKDCTKKDKVMAVVFSFLALGSILITEGASFVLKGSKILSNNDSFPDAYFNLAGIFRAITMWLICLLLLFVTKLSLIVASKSSSANKESKESSVEKIKKETHLINEEKFVTAEEYAQYNDLTEDNIIQMIKSGILAGKVEDGKWLVDQTLSKHLK